MTRQEQFTCDSLEMGAVDDTAIITGLLGILQKKKKKKERKKKKMLLSFSSPLSQTYLSVKLNESPPHGYHQPVSDPSCAQDVVGGNAGLAGVHALAPDDATGRDLNVSVWSHQNWTTCKNQNNI